MLKFLKKVNLLFFLLGFAFSVLTLFANSTSVLALQECKNVGIEYDYAPKPIPIGKDWIIIEFKTGITPGKYYRLRFDTDNQDPTSWVKADSTSLKIVFPGSGNHPTLKAKLSENKEHWSTLLRADDEKGSNAEARCGYVKFFVGPNLSKNTCKISFLPETPRENERFKIIVSGFPVKESRSAVTRVKLKSSFEGLLDSNISSGQDPQSADYVVLDQNGYGELIAGPLRPGTRTISLYAPTVPDAAFSGCTNTLKVIPDTGIALKPSCSIIQPSTAGGDVKMQAINLPADSYFAAYLNSTRLADYDSGTSGVITVSLGSLQKGDNVASFYNSSGQHVCSLSLKGDPNSQVTTGTSVENKKCTDPKNCSSGGGQSCNQGIDKGTGIMTAIGCIPTEPQALVQGLLKVSVNALGAIALLLMVLGAFKMITSDGNADSIQGGKDQFVASFLGLLFIIFSVLILELIGVRILSLPGFS